MVGESDVADTHHIDADPAFHLDADPHSNFTLMQMRIQKQIRLSLGFESGIYTIPDSASKMTRIHSNTQRRERPYTVYNPLQDVENFCLVSRMCTQG
jgi:hypothetical protein